MKRSAGKDYSHEGDLGKVKERREERREERGERREERGERREERGERGEDKVENKKVIQRYFNIKIYIYIYIYILLSTRNSQGNNHHKYRVEHKLVIQ